MSRAPRKRAVKSVKRPTPIWIPAVIAVLILLAGAAEALYFGSGPNARNGAASTSVVLAPGSGVSGIGQSLEKAGVIRSRFLFMAAATVTGAARQLKAGEYAFPSRAALATVLDTIRAGKVVRHVVTIPEGLTSKAAVEILNGTAELTGLAKAPAEGALLPETYEVTRGEDRAAVLNRMVLARDKLLADLWESRAKGLPYRSPDEAVILASIVEKETAKPSERPLIAAVFVNRLEKGMRLESDPTVIYGLTSGAPLGHGLRVSELASDTPYNTYRISGLPPTPIANPGRASLEAALDPAPSEALYFVADGAGGHVFADTLDAHLRNFARWRAIEQARAAPNA
jgi:UPF0755 protein